jgi:hypothetical protein
MLPEFVSLKKEVEQEKLQNAWQATDPKDAAQRYERVIGWATKHFGQGITASHQGSASGILYLESEMKAKANLSRTDDYAAGANLGQQGGDLRTEVQRRTRDPRYNPAHPSYDRYFVDETIKMSLADAQ